MGRPLNKKYFGNRNIGTTATTDSGIGGEGVASIAVTGSFTGRTTATPYAVTIGAPTLPGGVQAVATITFSSATAGAVTVSEKGSGYVSAPTATCALGGGAGTVVLTATLSTDSGDVSSLTNQENAISITARILTADGGTAALVGDIVSQRGSRRFKVKTSDGTGVVTLAAVATPTSGYATVIATDALGTTYWVTQISSHKALLTQKVVDGAGAEFGPNGTVSTNTKARWSLASPVTGVVQIANA